MPKAGPANSNRDTRLISATARFIAKAARCNRVRTIIVVAARIRVSDMGLSDRLT